jgi:hypothetical protein
MTLPRTPTPATEEDIQRNIQKHKEESEESARRHKLQQEKEEKFRIQQVLLMQKDQNGIKFIESQIESLKILITYLKEIDYHLPLHMSLKPYAVVVDELSKTVSKIWSAKYMEEEWTRKYAHEVGLLKDQIDGAMQKVKAQQRLMVYL